MPRLQNKLPAFAAAACLLSLSPRSTAEEAPATPAAESSAPSPEGEAEHRPNIASARFAYSRHVLNADETTSSGTFRDADNLYGFIVSYERVLVPDWLTLEVAKPFLWGPGRFDSPFDVTLVKPFRLSKKWELFVGAGVTLNFRVFDEEHSTVENGNERTVGILATGGVAYNFTPQWGLLLAVDYAYIPGNVYVTQELSPSLGPTFSFR